MSTSTMTLELKVLTTEYWRCTRPTHPPILVQSTGTDGRAPVCPWCAAQDADVALPAGSATRLLAQVEDLRTRLTDLHDVATDTSDLKPSLSTDTSDLTTQLAELRDMLSTVSSQIEEIEGQIGDIDDNVELDDTDYLRSVTREYDIVHDQVEQLRDTLRDLVRAAGAAPAQE